VPCPDESAAVDLGWKKQTQNSIVRQDSIISGDERKEENEFVYCVPEKAHK